MTWSPVLPPFPHQVEALARMREQKAFALLMEMRTGKTKVIIDDWGEKLDAGEVRDLLYVSPGGALYGEDALETQVTQHMPPEVHERAMVHVWRSGAGSGARRELGKFLACADPARPRVLLVNVESLSLASTGAREACAEFLLPGRAMMVAGESTCIKGDSKRTEAILELGKLAPWRRIETGLVAPHSPLDLYHQFEFLDHSILNSRSDGNFWTFRARYAVLKKVCFLPTAKQEELRRAKRRVPETIIVVAYRNEDELAERIAPWSYRKRLADCYDAPKDTYRFRDVELTRDQARMYSEFRRYATTAIEGAEAHMTATVALTQVIRLHQLVCGYVVDEGGAIHDVPEGRTTALVGLLEECAGKAVVWASYDHNVRRIIAVLKKHFGEESTAAFWGGNLSTREADERRFKADPRCRFMVATAAAGGKGRKWNGANLMAYYSNSPNLEHREQSEMRAAALGKVDPVTRVDLRCPGTVDDKMVANLRRKIDIASTLQGDGYREWLV